MSASINGVSSAASEGYDAFISYKSGHSTAVARYVRSSLYELGKRHNPDKPIRVFLDQTSLMGGVLDERIKGPLKKSRNLIVLLDSKTRESPWVSEEIDTWLAHGGSADRLFLVRTDPAIDLTWGDGNFKHAERLPHPLRSAFKAQQKWFDVPTSRGRAGDGLLAGLFAAVMGIDPEALLLEEAQYQQRQRRRSRQVLTAVVGLLVIALVAAGAALANWRASEAATVQAQADADAAQSLLTLPVSSSEAIDLAIRAADASSSSSVRAMLLAVSAGLGRLERTADFPGASGGAVLSGVNFNADGTRLLGWGSSSTGQSAIVVWDVASGDAVADFSVPVEHLTDLVELPRHAYLGCASGRPVRIDWLTHDVTYLSPGGEQVDSRAGGHCATALTAVSAVLLYGEDGPRSLYAETITGEREDLEQGASWSVNSGMTSRLFAAVDNSETEGVDYILSSAGLVAVPDEVRGELVNQHEDVFFLRKGSVYSGLRVAAPDRLNSISLGDFPTAIDALGVQDYSSKLGLFWIDQTGVVHDASGGALALYDPNADILLNPSARGTYEPSLFTVSRGLYASVGSSVWELMSSPSVVLGAASQSRRLTSVALPSVAEQGVSPVFEGCESEGGAAVVFAGGRYAAFWAGSFVGVRATSPTLMNCQLIDTSPPFSINGEEIASGGAPRAELRSMSPNGTLAYGNTAGIIHIVGSGVGGTVPWRTYPTAGDVISAAGGTRSLTWSFSELLLNGPEGTQSFRPGLNSRWLGARPDGTGGIYVADNKLHAGHGADDYSPLVSGCYGVPMFYAPDPGFTTSVAAAERQRLVSRTDPSIDCVTGDEVESSGLIFSYVVTPEVSHIVWNSEEDSTPQLTVWKPGASRPLLTSVLPGEGSIASRLFSLNADGSVLITGSSDSHRVSLWRWGGTEWDLVRDFSTTVSDVADVAISPDGLLAVAVGVDGTFDIADTATGRILAREHASNLNDDEKIRRVFVTDDDGLMSIHVSLAAGTKTIEVPVSVDRLRSQLCGVRKSASC